MRPEEKSFPKKITEWSVAIHLVLKHYVPSLVLLFTGDLSMGIAFGLLLGNFSVKETINAFRGKDFE